ncbi:glycoside hydrolase family 3 [Paenibacillus sp. J31TS4]|uniref:beta-N-acetylhexosaminidase n=1 Tax=Paenibacillus sp. J31TS4 TaxID=2807195 RepID=UPI001B25769A|nr:beta-N-acetylhexosaminidase [Paenibacillus sp. J31TS4]GIP40107.1 glycoside hydrolase family 3 [Paenibacillus sp. J31TS4]
MTDWIVRTNRLRRWAGGLLALGLLAGCGAGGGASQASPGPSAGNSPQASLSGSPAPSGTPEPKPTPAPDPIQTRVAAMTLDEKLGQMLLVGIDGQTMDENAKKLVATHRVGGIILYKPNIANASQTYGLLNALKEANKEGKAPLFLSVDQEGGKVSRMPEEFAKLPGAAEVGCSNDAGYARRIGASLGEEVKTLGFNMNFAPVLDINSNPANPVIGERSLGSKAELVGRLGIAEMKGLQETGVVPVVKHFPGHGDTSVDSHLELPVVAKSLEELKALELQPFREAVKEGADAVMIAHILLPKLDPDHPSSFSRRIITGLLREELGYKGVVITDDMTMGAIIGHYDLGQAAVQSVQAGTDILLVAHEYAKATAVLDALKQAVAQGKLDEARIDESVARILRLKDKYRLTDAKAPAPEVERVNASVREVLSGGAGAK